MILRGSTLVCNVRTRVTETAQSHLIMSPVSRWKSIPHPAQVFQYPTFPGCCSRRHRKTLTSCGSRDSPSGPEPEKLQFEREKTDVHSNTHVGLI